MAWCFVQAELLDFEQAVAVADSPPASTGRM